MGVVVSGNVISGNARRANMAGVDIGLAAAASQNTQVVGNIIGLNAPGDRRDR